MVSAPNRASPRSGEPSEGMLKARHCPSIELSKTILYFIYPAVPLLLQHPRRQLLALRARSFLRALTSRVTGLT